MTFCGDLCEGIRGNCREFMTAPLSRQKILILGGVVIFIIILIIVISVSVSGSSSSTPAKGSDAIKSVPLTLGNNNLAIQLKTKYFNKINSADLSSFTDPLKKGFVGLQIWTIGVSCSASQYKDSVGQIMEQIDVMKRMANKQKLKIVTNLKSIESVKPSEVAGMLALDGGYVLDSRPAMLRIYNELGIKIFRVGNCDSPWNTKDNFEKYGKSLIKEMNRLGMILDLTGASHDVQLSAMDASAAPVIFSASNINATVNHPNNLGDDVLKKAAEKHALVMVSFAKKQMCANLTDCTETNAIHMIESLVKQVKADHVGIGGGFGGDDEYVMDSTGFAAFFDHLYSKTKMSMSDLKKIASKNFMGIIRSVEKIAAASKELALEDLQPEDMFPKDLAVAKYPCYSDFDSRYPSKPPATEPPKEPTKEPPKEPTKKPPKEPTKEPTKEPPKNPTDKM